ncbi:MAG: hypothetical protein PHF65_06030 [Oscillospiraceae bacterium]|nr:hypothetical protein [Oscillospiraceae bacterium]
MGNQRGDMYGRNAITQAFGFLNIGRIKLMITRRQWGLGFYGLNEDNRVFEQLLVSGLLNEEFSDCPLTAISAALFA